MNRSSGEEAERLLRLSEKLLQKGDLKGSRELAIIAQETEPLLEASDQLIAIMDVIEAAQKPLNDHNNNNNNNNNLDWYAILQVDRNCQDLNLIKKQYRRLALLLHPDKNPFSYSHHAFKLVSDAWAVLSNPAHKPIYDMGLDNRGPSSFWTACPYCYLLYEYPRVYEGCCLMCQNCEKSFHGLSIPSLPPIVPGQEAYYCSWGCFPMGFVFENLEHVESAGNLGEPEPVAVTNGVGSVTKKRGRPRKVV